MNGRAHWTIFLIAAAVGPNQGIAQSSPIDLRELLRKTAAVYSTESYDLRAETATSQLLLNAPGTGRGAAPPRPPPDLPLVPTEFHMIRSARAMRVEIRSAGSGWEHSFASDGKTVWHFPAKGNEYSERAADQWPAIPGPSDALLPGLDWKHFTRFRAIEGALPLAKLVRLDHTCDGLESARVEIRSDAGAPEPWSENLWIQVSSGLVCRLESSRLRSARGQVTEVRSVQTWKYATVGRAAPDPALFTFQPRPGSKRVKELRPPGFRN